MGICHSFFFLDLMNLILKMSRVCADTIFGHLLHLKYALHNSVKNMFRSDMSTDLNNSPTTFFPVQRM